MFIEEIFRAIVLITVLLLLGVGLTSNREFLRNQISRIIERTLENTENTVKSAALLLSFVCLSVVILTYSMISFIAFIGSFTFGDNIDEYLIEPTLVFIIAILCGLVVVSQHYEAESGSVRQKEAEVIRAGLDE